jgi:purine-nucleoside phosphorylase
MHKKLESLWQKPPVIAVQLGSGLKSLADTATDAVHIPYEEIPGLPRPGVEGHGGEFIFGYVESLPVLFLSGRVHYYEGKEIDEVTAIVRLVHALGIPRLFLTNAAGAVNETFRPGDLMMITDHINFSGINPLRGPYHEKDGPRFPDQSEVYTKHLQEKLLQAAQETAVSLKKGVYIWFTGPSYETPAEVKAARVLGADAVGMSTVPEAMVANRLGMEVCGISMISNMAAGIIDSPLSHEEVLEAAKLSEQNFRQLFLSFIRSLKNARI